MELICHSLFYHASLRDLPAESTGSGRVDCLSLRSSSSKNSKLRIVYSYFSSIDFVLSFLQWAFLDGTHLMLPAGG